MPLNTYGHSLGPAADVYEDVYFISPITDTRAPPVIFFFLSSSLSPDGRIEGVWARAAIGSVLDGRSGGMGATGGGGCCSPAWPRGLGGCCARGHGGPELLRLEPRRGHGGRSCCAAMVGGARAQLWRAEAPAPRAPLAPPGMGKQQQLVEPHDDLTRRSFLSRWLELEAGTPSSPSAEPTLRWLELRP